jgi:hypothetical protein
LARIYSENLNRSRFEEVLQTATNGQPVIYLPLRLAGIEICYQTSGVQLALSKCETLLERACSRKQ